MPFFDASSFDALRLVELALIGGVLGFAGGIFGIGGGVLVIPVLTLWFGLDQATAQGTALAMMAPNLLIAWRRYTHYNPAPLRDVLGVATAAVLTTALTAQVAGRVDQALLGVIFWLFLLFVAVQMIVAALRRGAAPSEAALGRNMLPLVGVAGGASLGLLGVGGGLLATPLLIRFFGMTQRAAQSLSLSLVAPGAVSALGSYAAAGRVDWLTGACLAAGGAATVAAGVKVAQRLPDKTMRVLFGIMLALTAAWMLLGA